MIATQLPTCANCIATVQIGYYNHDTRQHESLCYALRKSGHCQIAIGRDLADRQIAAMNNLADALRSSRLPGIEP